VSSGKDLNGDGQADILVGAPYLKAGNYLYQGQVFAFNGANGSLLFSIKDPRRQPFAEFALSREPCNSAGASAALVKDLTGDGKPDIVIGAPYQNVKGVLRAGEAFVFDGQNGALVAEITARNPQTFAGPRLQCDARHFPEKWFS
jgi:hypothetical protein